MPKVSLSVYKGESGGIGAAFGVSCWFKLTCQVVCYEAVPGHMGQRGNVQGMKPSERMHGISRGPGLEVHRAMIEEHKKMQVHKQSKQLVYRQVQAPSKGP